MRVHPRAFPYQRTGAEWLAARQNALLADDMGVGKTSQAIWGADLIRDQNILVLCPGIGRDTWQKEFYQWQQLQRSVGLVTDTQHVPKTDVVISSYSTILGRPVLEQLLGRRWDHIICDEAHYLKSPDAVRTKIVYGALCTRAKGLGAVAKGIWLLTGTPFPNGPHEAWTHARALFPDAACGLETYPEWQANFCVTAPGIWNDRVIGTKNISDFVARLKPYVLRRLLDDVQPDLPPERYGLVVLNPSNLPPMPELPPEITTTVAAAQAKLLSDDYHAEGEISDNAAEALAYVQSAHLSSLRRWIGVAKAHAAAEAIKEDMANGLKKVVIFAVHREVIAILAKIIPRSAVLHGGVPVPKRQTIIDAFQTHPPNTDLDALICQIDLASTNLTLTVAHDVAFVETTWVPKDVSQGVRRCRRIGQTHPVLARIYSLKGSLDEVVGATLARKANLTSAIEQSLA